MDDFEFEVDVSAPPVAPASAPAATVNSVKTATVLEYWKGIGLEGQRASWDASMEQVTRHKESSVQARKMLAEETRAFKRKADADKLTAFPALLKAYQGEIDNLTRRSKFAEATWVHLYTQLSDAPDPVPALGVALRDAERALDAVAAERAARARLDDAQARQRELVEERAGVLLQEQQEAQRAEQREEVALWRERVAALEAERDGADARIEEARRAQRRVEQERLEEKEKFVQAQDALQREMDILVEDVERLNARNATLQDALEAGGGTGTPTAGGDAAGGDSTHLRVQVAQRDVKINELAEQLAAAQAQLDALSQQSEHAGARAESTAAELSAELAQVRAELAGRPTRATVDELRSQLAVLQAMQFSAADVRAGDEGAGAGAGAGAGVAGGDDARLEHMLANKVKRLEDTLTHLRVQLDEKSAQVTEMQLAAQRSEEQLRDQRKLVATLEEDLLRGSTKEHTFTPQKMGDLLDGGVSGGAMAGAIAKQRDRLRAELKQVEERCLRLQTQLHQAHEQEAALKQDNVQLYGKIRYLQSYADEYRAKAGSASSAADMEAGRRESSTERRYKSAYEARVNPFNQFSRNEKIARIRDLGPIDRFLLQGSNVILSHKWLRKAVFGYILVLHLLVMVIMYGYTHTSCVVLDRQFQAPDE